MVRLVIWDAIAPIICRSKKTSKLRDTGLCEGIHRGPVDSPHKRPATQKMFPFDDVIIWSWRRCRGNLHPLHEMICLFLISIASFWGQIKCWNHLCIIFCPMITHIYHEEFATIALVSFQVYYHWSFRKSVALVGSTQSSFCNLIKLLWIESVKTSSMNMDSTMVLGKNKPLDMIIRKAKNKVWLRCEMLRNTCKYICIKIIKTMKIVFRHVKPMVV